MAYTAESFLEKIKPLVLADMKQSGILASLTASQALIESNKGNSGLAVKANNLFGIKGNYYGEYVTMPTTEYYGGQPYKVNAQFRKYPSWKESIADHSALFNRMNRYKNLRGCTDWRKATVYVKEDGYATSPTYTETLQNTIKKYNLDLWDMEVVNNMGFTSSSSSLEQAEVNGNPYKEPTKTIRLNSRGNDVRWLQYELNKRGYHLVVDGVAGLKTIGALTDFQVKSELSADGICGPLTRAALKLTTP